MKLWLLKWLYQWSRIVDGLIGVLTFCLVNTNLSLTTATILAKARFKEKGFMIVEK